VHNGSVLTLNGTQGFLISTVVSVSKDLILYVGATTTGNVTGYLPVNVTVIYCMEHPINVLEPQQPILKAISTVEQSPVKLSLVNYFESTLTEYCPVTFLNVT